MSVAAWITIQEKSCNKSQKKQTLKREVWKVNNKEIGYNLINYLQKKIAFRSG